MPRTDQTKARTPSAKRRLEFGDDANNTPKTSSSSSSSSTTTTPVVSAAAVAPSLVMGTPEKKKRRRDRQDGVITGYFSSPTKTLGAAVVVVTPETKQQQQQQQSPRPQTTQEPSSYTYVPEHIHKNLQYQRRGKAVLSDTMQRVFDLVEEHCNIPADFENDRRYGPLSGTCFEERLVHAYDRGWIQSKSKSKSESAGVEVCTQCAELGHGRDDCPTL
eukprot:jgi/Psemu1/304736/fgenesh1_kg.167_\